GVGPVLPGENLSEVEERAWATAEYLEGDELERWVDTISEPLKLYWRSHSLRAALPGARVPPIMIGRNHGEGEISLRVLEGQNEDGESWEREYNAQWAYPFDMDDFCTHLHEELHHFLSSWM